MKHVVYGVLTRYLRFLPRTYQGGVCMRTEIFGVKKSPSEYNTLMYFCMCAIIMLSLLLPYCESSLRYSFNIYTSFSRHVKGD